MCNNNDKGVVLEMSVKTEYIRNKDIKIGEFWGVNSLQES